MPDEFRIIERCNGLMLGFNYYPPHEEYAHHEVNIYFLIVQFQSRCLPKIVTGKQLIS